MYERLEKRVLILQKGHTHPVNAAMQGAGRNLFDVQINVRTADGLGKQQRVLERVRREPIQIHRDTMRKMNGKSSSTS